VLAVLTSSQPDTEAEWRLHLFFRALRVRGEWFDFTGVVFDCALAQAREFLPKSPKMQRIDEATAIRIPDFARATGLTRQRIHQAIDSGYIQVQEVPNLRIDVIPRTEMRCFEIVSSESFDKENKDHEIHDRTITGCRFG